MSTALHRNGLRYATDASPGIKRHKVRKGFAYHLPGGKLVKNRSTLARIKALAIPPAWGNVWICLSENGHLQATGRDARGRKQYRYHPKYRSHRDETKFSRLARFARRLPDLRQRVRLDLQKEDLNAEKVLATVTRLLDVTGIRVGNTEYARANGSYGLTTLRDKHVQVKRSGISFQFRGKSGIEHQLDIDDPKLARIVRQCRDLPGYELFQYLDVSGNRCTIDSEMVNDYIREAMGEDFSAKDFRTWHGTVEAAMILSACSPPSTKKELNRVIRSAVDAVAERLGNRPATCRKFYIHPDVVEAFSGGSLPAVEVRTRRSTPLRGLSSEEKSVLRLLTKRRPQEGNVIAPSHTRRAQLARHAPSHRVVQRSRS